MFQTNNVGYLLNHMASVLGRQSDQVLQERLGIGFSQFKIMMVLKWNPSIRQKQIATQLAQTEASISRQIKLLHEQGVLATQINPKNRREHITTLTHRGERFTNEALKVLNNYHAPIFAELSEKDQQKITEILGKMHEISCGSSRPGSCHFLPGK